MNRQALEQPCVPQLPSANVIDCPTLSDLRQKLSQAIASNEVPADLREERILSAFLAVTAKERQITIQVLESSATVGTGLAIEVIKYLLAEPEKPEYREWLIQRLISVFHLSGKIDLAQLKHAAKHLQTNQTFDTEVERIKFETTYLRIWHRAKLIRQQAAPYEYLYGPARTAWQAWLYCARANQAH
jgi:hypothetical protein